MENKMKKIFILVLMVLVGISLVFVNVKAEEARTIPMKSGVAISANTVILAHGGTLYKITGRATSSNASYVVYNAATVATATAAYSQVNILAEGGEATQYDSFDTLDFGSEGLEFSTGLTVITTTCDVAVLYR